MASRDLFHELSPGIVLVSPNITNGATGARTVNGNAIDLKGSESCTLIIATGALTDSDEDRELTFTLQESDAAGSGFTTVEDHHVIGFDSAVVELNINTISGENIGESTIKIGYKGNKRYIRT